MENFRALRIYTVDGGVEPRLEMLSIDDLNDGEVIIKVAWSCVN
jgi:hypothetical protein